MCSTKSISTMMALKNKWEKHAMSDHNEIEGVADYSAILTKWRSSFATTVYKATKSWKYQGYDWHAFSFNFTLSIQGIEAARSYESCPNQPSYLFTHEGKHEACLHLASKPSHDEIRTFLDLYPIYADIYVTSLRFDWTFVSTHEERAGIGPFFSRIKP